VLLCVFYLSTIRATYVPNPDFVAFHHSLADAVVSLSIRLPTCAEFRFYTERFNEDIANGRLRRSDKISYELPEAYALYYYGRTIFVLGRTMTVHVHTNGPARFIVEHGQPDGIAWFDTQ